MIYRKKHYIFKYNLKIKVMTNFVKNMNHIPVQENIYTSNGGRSFRVRMTIDGKRFSKNFKNKQKAQSFRKQLLALREIA